MVLDGYSSAVRALSALVPFAELPLALGTVALLCCSGTQLCQGKVCDQSGIQVVL